MFTWVGTVASHQAIFSVPLALPPTQSDVLGDKQAETLLHARMSAVETI